MSFAYQGGTAVLQGILPQVKSCPSITLSDLATLENQDQIWCLLELHKLDTSASMFTKPTEIQQLIDEFAALFHPPTGLPPKRSSVHSIPLISGAQPFRIRPYRYNAAQKDEIEKQVQQLLDNGWIQESHSPYASPVLLVKKKTGDWRLCVDYRKLNALIVKNKFPIPVIDELLDELVGAKWFTTLDLSSGFHQILVAEEDVHKTAFQTHHGHYEYKVMPYGVTGGPPTFQHEMNTVLAPVLRKFAVVFIDDVLIYSKTWSDHVQHVRQVFTLLHQSQFKVKLSKCSFAQQQLSYLGHVISSQGVATDPSKVDIIRHWPVPTSVKDVRSFLGLAGYYRKFVSNFGIISRPLTNLLKKGVIFVWTSEHDIAFCTLKEALVSAPVLALPDLTKPFVIETDASDKGIGAVLQQGGHPVAFVSRALGPKNQALSTYEKEYLAILLAVEYWRSYLQQNEFTIRTDQKSLVHLNDQRLSTPWQQKALTKLMGLRYKICYKKGTENRVADALSRVTNHPTQQVMALSTVQPLWVQDLVDAYHIDPATTKLLSALAVKSPQGHFSLLQGSSGIKVGSGWVTI